MKTFAIYPGRFHPFHKGHKSVYDFLVEKYGASFVYITATGVTDPIKSPFTFEERKSMMVLTGIPSDKIVEVKNNYNLSPLVSLIPIDINTDAICFTISRKDMLDDPRFKNFTKKDGSPSYPQPFPTNGNPEPAIKHGYLIVAPTETFSVMGVQVNSATELRNRYVSLKTPQEKQKFLTDLFGKFDQNIMKSFDEKLKTTALKEVIKRMLREDMDADIRALVKKRDTIDLEVEKLRLKKTEGQLRAAIDTLKSVKDQGGDIDVSKASVDNLKKEYDAAKKRITSANIKRSA